MSSSLMMVMAGIALAALSRTVEVSLGEGVLLVSYAKKTLSHIFSEGFSNGPLLDSFNPVKCRKTAAIISFLLQV